MLIKNSYNMKNNKYIISISFFILLIILFSACQKDKYYLYNDVARIQFGPEPNRIYTTSFDLADTLKMQTFYYYADSKKEDTVYFDIYAIGGIKNEDRSFTLEQEQVPDRVNAEPGKHYVAFNDPRAAKNYIIKAGTVTTKVPIILLRDVSLKTITPILKFVIKANNDFQLGEMSKVWRKLEFTDRLSQPGSWDTWFSTYYFGKYSVTKHLFMIQSTGDKWDNDMFTGLKSDLSLLNFKKAVLVAALIDYNKANSGNPLRDEFGELVVFP